MSTLFAQFCTEYNPAVASTRPHSDCRAASNLCIFCTYRDHSGAQWSLTPQQLQFNEAGQSPDTGKTCKQSKGE